VLAQILFLYVAKRFCGLPLLLFERGAHKKTALSVESSAVLGELSTCRVFTGLRQTVGVGAC
jgi:hypothetical protein